MAKVKELLTVLCSSGVQARPHPLPIHSRFPSSLSYFLTSPFYGSSTQHGNLRRSLVFLSHTSLDPLNHFLAPT